MQWITDLSAFRPDPARPLVLILGNFDGVHLGHQSLLTFGLEEARRRKAVASVLTFSNHPQEVLHPAKGPALLTTEDHRLYLLERHGVELCLMIPFTLPFSEMKAEEFVEEVLVRRLGIHQVGLGFNARFGHDRKGDAALMQELARRFGFLFWESQPVKVHGESVSSSRIRELVRAGKLHEAAAFLGRPFGFFGKVVEGEKRGAGLGAPTANLEAVGQLFPPEGVYAVRARLIRSEKKMDAAGRGEICFFVEGDWLRGVMNYGRRPTFPSAGTEPVAEVHLLDEGRSLYGRVLEVEVVSRLRPEKAFTSPEALKRQIQMDIEEARKILSAVK